MDTRRPLGSAAELCTGEAAGARPTRLIYSPLAAWKTPVLVSWERWSQEGVGSDIDTSPELSTVVPPGPHGSLGGKGASEPRGTNVVVEL